MKLHPLSGVYAAAITPLNDDYSIALEAIPTYLSFLAQRGCHGALLLGTTGEGPSFNNEERRVIFKAGAKVWEEYPDFRLLAGTGTPSLQETAEITKFAFNLGFAGAVVLPPYYYHQATEAGIYDWFQELIQRAIPADGYLLGYHIPAQSGVPIPEGVLNRLREAYPNQFIGIKDSTATADYTQKIGKSLDEDFVALVGNDRLLSQALDMGGSGCITALANLHSPGLRVIWEAHQNGKGAPEAQAKINAQQEVLSRYAPFPPSVKALVSRLHNFPLWAVKTPLTPLSPEKSAQAYQEMLAVSKS